MNSQFIGKATYAYIQDGITACGTRHNDSEYVVAINRVQFDPYTPNNNPNRNSLCDRKIEIFGPNGLIEAKIVDRCSSCAYGDLSLSPAVFQVIAGNLSIGAVPIKWNWY